MNEPDWIDWIIAAVIVIPFYIALFTFISYIGKTEAYKKWQLRVAKEYVEHANNSGKRGMWFEDSQKVIHEYMVEHNITEINIDGQTIRKDIKMEDRPPAFRVAYILLRMGYTREHIQHIISKGLVQLGMDVKFDELLEFSLKYPHT